MSQKLILPIDNCRLTAGYKSAAYKKQIGFPHYGTDMVSLQGATQICASGMGRVIAAGADGNNDKDRMGNCIVLVYPEVQLPNGRTLDIACRLFHFSTIAVKAGDTIAIGQLLGTYGNTGRYSKGAHLHMEFDTDAKYPRHAMGLASSGKIILRGTIDSTLAAADVLFLGSGQKITTDPASVLQGWVEPREITLRTR